jgi:hypothetical protein
VRRLAGDAGYSGTPLVAKLGIKAGQRVAIVHGPRGISRTLGALPPDVRLSDRLAARAPMIVAFATSHARLLRNFALWKRALARDGSLWVCWPKRSSGASTDLDENKVRHCGLAGRLVDVKVCAVDATWSGLKFVYRLADRGR